MVKLVAMYKKPANVEEFDDLYFNTHLPLANKMPGVRKVEIARILGTPVGDSEFYLMAEVYFDSKEDLQAAMASPEGRASTKNLMSFAKDIASFLIADVEKVPANANP